MSSAQTANTKRSLPVRLLRVTLLRVILWITGIGVLLIAIAAIWAWNQRYALMERQAITYFQSMGITADLRIRSATGTKADVRNIRLSYEDTPFLTLDRMQASYQWRELLNGQVERLDFTGLNATVTIDADGNIVDGWRPPSTGGGAGLPKGGIHVRKARLDLRTPYGDLPFTGNLSLSSLQDFALEGRIDQTRIAWDDVTAQLEGPISVTREGSPLSLDMPSTRLSLTHPSGSLTNTIMAVSGTYDPLVAGVDGAALFVGGTFDSAAGIDGQIDQLSAHGSWAHGELRATLEAALPRIGLNNAQRRRDLSRMLSLADALSEIPVAQNFAPSLVAPVEELLAESSVDAVLDVTLTDQVRRVRLRGPLTLRTVATQNKPAREAVLTSVETDPFYQYRVGDPTYTLALQASLSHPVPLRLTPLSVTIRSDDGLIPTGTESAAGRLQTQASWRARTRNNRPARLAPLSIAFDYSAPLGAASRLRLDGGADYDGDIPGGYVEALKTSGTLSTVLHEDGLSLDFSPRRPLSLRRFETTSEWIIEDFTGTLLPRSPLYSRSSGAPARIHTGLRDAALRASRPASDISQAAELDLQIGTAGMTGTIADTTQSWSIDFTQLLLRSETFPVEGTDLSLSDGALTVHLSDGGRSEFALSTPSSTLITPLYRVRDMALDAQGTAENYRLTYSGGRVRVMPPTEDSPPLPVLSVSGDMTFADGLFTGTAQTALPQVPDNPIDIAYRLQEGRGEADIAIRDLRFRPRGLQPQDLAPALRGKIAQVNGAIDADLSIGFGGDAPITSSGTVQIKNMALGTAPGPVTGLSGTVELTSLFPVVTAPDQVLRIGTFDPGVPLTDGTLTYALVAEGVAIADAIFPLGDGRISFDPFLWTYGATENRVTLRVSDVQVGDFLNNIGDGRLSVTGEIQGAIPVVIRGIDVRVEKGRLEVSNGGTIRYSGRNPMGSATVSPAGQAFAALENLQYQSLFAEVDGPLDGAITMGVLFTGSNPDVLFGTPFQFDMTVEGELFNIARSLNPNGIQDRIISSLTSQPQDAPTQATED